LSHVKNPHNHSFIAMAETNKLTQNTMIVNDGIPGDNNVDS